MHNENIAGCQAFFDRLRRLILNGLTEIITAHCSDVYVSSISQASKHESTKSSDS